MLNDFFSDFCENLNLISIYLFLILIRKHQTSSIHQFNISINLQKLKSVYSVDSCNIIYPCADN
ncbi:hypothetical protein BpHYR1_025799 [Brachionus plicatilis]|uniref:Uncharacterized protein n=1 Tax=Brachionus plicatilis TaxID=10195 RepID=A0A3M7RUN6_BRAPC|nr:hypothetical protein BpHYR1_025799 [Brachionus plicatilis]